MDYRTALEKLKLTELRKLVSTYLKHLRVKGTTKNDYIEHLLKYTKYENGRILIKEIRLADLSTVLGSRVKREEEVIRNRRQRSLEAFEESKQTGKYDTKPPRQRLIKNRIIEKPPQYITNSISNILRGEESKLIDDKSLEILRKLNLLLLDWFNYFKDNKYNEFIKEIKKYVSKIKYNDNNIIRIKNYISEYIDN